jgi:hypothetical protein
MEKEKMFYTIVVKKKFEKITLKGGG